VWKRVRAHFCCAKQKRENEASSQGKRQEARAGEGCEASAEAGKQRFYRPRNTGREGEGNQGMPSEPGSRRLAEWVVEKLAGTVGLEHYLSRSMSRNSTKRFPQKRTWINVRLDVDLENNCCRPCHHIVLITGRVGEIPEHHPMCARSPVPTGPIPNPNARGTSHAFPRTAGER